MEKIKALINRLQEQAEQNASLQALQATVQQLQLELSEKETYSGKRYGTTKVAVVMPAHSRYLPQAAEVMQVAEKIPATKEPSMPAYQPLRKEEQNLWSKEVLNEAPALSPQNTAKELNDIIGSMGTSLNDTLKVQQTELAETLTESPIRDLKKGIAINDRYVFVSELFRGDEAMYERSIKTINGFHILAEAEYWMERELKVKLGWDDDKNITQHFYQLVKRRFS